MQLQYSHHTGCFSVGQVKRKSAFIHTWKYRHQKSEMQRISRRSDGSRTEWYMYTGIWKNLACATFLGRTVSSIYPKVASVVRKDLHRLVIPRTSSQEKEACYIMWTSTRSNMQPARWFPSHFSAVLPLTSSIPVTLTDSDSLVQS